jgi:lipopolysaccharide transport system ATP-binding protein
MSHKVELVGVSLDYQVYSVRAKSLRNAALNLAVGGKLYKGSGDLTVLRALSGIYFKLDEGDRLAIIGHNGSGKTTLLKVISGIYEPTSGTVDVRGRLTSMIGFGAGLEMEASGLENIRKVGTMHQIPSRLVKQRTDAIIDFAGLGAFIHLPARTYSAGMLARLMFSISTEFPADILVLDEWLSAGDADFRDKAAQRMNEFVSQSNNVIMASHDFDLVRRVCNKVLVLDGGEQKFFGPTEEWFAQAAA